MKIRKKLTILLFVFLAMVLVACSGEETTTTTTITELELPETLSMTIDGVIDEEAYQEIPVRYAGVQGAVEIRFASSQEGLYVGLITIDDNQQVSRSGGLLMSDYVGIAIDTAAQKGANDGITENTVLFRYDVSNRYTYSEGDDYGAWQEMGVGTATELNEEGKPVYRLVVEEGVKYTAEFFFSWELLGTTSEDIQTNNSLMYYVEHRNVGVDIKADSNIASPSSYNTLTLMGDRKGHNKPASAPEITVDGVMDETVWETATITNQGNFSTLFSVTDAGDFITKAFFGENGLYIGLQADDMNLWAPKGTGEAYKNDGMEMRIHVYDSEGLPLQSLKLLFDLFGPQWHETVSGGLTSSFAPLAEYAYDINGTINDDSDTDIGWGFELYIPYSQLNIENNTDYVRILHAVGTFEQNNALPEYYRNNPDNIVGSDLSWDFPENYIKIEEE